MEHGTPRCSSRIITVMEQSGKLFLFSESDMVLLDSRLQVLSRFAVSFSHMASHVVGMLNVPPT
jgi:hypothetical protein